MSWSCPFHSFQLPLHVPDIFSVCLCHFPCMSRSFVASHFPTSPVVPIGFIALCFPVIPPALSVPLCFPSISRCFPDMWTSYFFPSFPCTSLHFPFAPQYFPQKTLCFQRFRKEDVQKQSTFPDFSLHFIAFPLGSPVFPTKTRFFQRFRKEDIQQQSTFPDFSLHFIAFPLGSPVFPTKTRFFQRFRKEDIQKQSFPAKASSAVPFAFLHLR